MSLMPIHQYIKIIYIYIYGKLDRSKRIYIYMTYIYMTNLTVAKEKKSQLHLIRNIHYNIT